MIKVRIELWMWMGEELGSDFQPLSRMCSVLETKAPEGTDVRTFLFGLAERHPAVARKVFDREAGALYPNVIMTFNDQVIGVREFYDRTLRDGDRIKVMPVYVGG
jgi:hypothetical protein